MPIKSLPPGTPPGVPQAQLPPAGGQLGQIARNMAGAIPSPTGGAFNSSPMVPGSVGAALAPPTAPGPPPRFTGEAIASPPPPVSFNTPAGQVNIPGQVAQMAQARAAARTNRSYERPAGPMSGVAALPTGPMTRSPSYTAGRDASGQSLADTLKYMK